MSHLTGLRACGFSRDKYWSNFRKWRVFLDVSGPRVPDTEMASINLLLLLLSVVSSAKLITSKASRSALNRVSTPRTLCERCDRPPTQCLCASLPRSPIQTSTRVLVLQHPKEARRRIASVPLIPLCLENVDVVKGVCFDDKLSQIQEALTEGFEPLLLFPGPAATCLDARDPQEPQGPARSKPKLLVLIDGTWTQARHMMQHSPGLASQCRHVMFEAPVASVFDALRREPEKHCMSTVEAVRVCSDRVAWSHLLLPTSVTLARSVLERFVPSSLRATGMRQQPTWRAAYSGSSHRSWHASVLVLLAS